MKLNIAGRTPPYEGPRKRSVAFRGLAQVAHARGADRDRIHLARRNYGCDKVVWPLGQPPPSRCVFACGTELTGISATRVRLCAAPVLCPPMKMRATFVFGLVDRYITEEQNQTGAQHKLYCNVPNCRNMMMRPVRQGEVAGPPALCLGVVGCVLFCCVVGWVGCCALVWNERTHIVPVAQLCVKYRPAINGNTTVSTPTSPTPTPLQHGTYHQAPTAILRRCKCSRPSIKTRSKSPGYVTKAV
jgi:hypothetical protein